MVIRNHKHFNFNFKKRKKKEETATLIGFSSFFRVSFMKPYSIINFVVSRLFCCVWIFIT